MKKKVILGIVLLFGVIFHWYFLHLNEVLKNADGFAYLQMTHYFNEFSLKGFGSGWFGFLYSLFLAPFTILFDNDFLVWKIVNLWLFAFSSYLVFKLSKKYLPYWYSIWVVLLFITSPVLLNFNIDILSENIYIPLFLLFFNYNLELLKNFSYKNIAILSFLVALMYFTRWEAFIYLLWTGLILVISLLLKKLTFSQFFKKSLTLLGLFLVFVSPYIFYMWTFTWEVWLTNKWASNFRQAQMRWIYTQDDEWFERAVWELTEDKKHLIAWFAGGLDYDKPSIEWGWVVKMILSEPKETISRWLTNQQKLYSTSLPWIFIWDGYRYWTDENWILERVWFGSKYVFLWLLFTILWFVIFGIYSFFKTTQKSFPIVFLSLYLVATSFFTIFFVIDRYFILFIPFFFIFFAFWLYKLPKKRKKLKKIAVFWMFLFFILVNLWWILRYSNYREPLDNYYELKKEAWEYLWEKHHDRDLKVMERFPVVTYYSGTKTRILTPFVESYEDIKTYAEHKDIDYLVVDTMDFARYRSQINELLKNPWDNYWFKVHKTFEKNNQKVILYKLYK